MSQRFEGQTVVVTGGASGIGAEVARRFYDEGAKVAIVDLAEEPINDFIDKEPSRDRFSGYACNVSDAASVNATIEQIAEDLGGINVLINNAGVGGFGKTADVSDDDWRKVMAVDLDGVFFVARAVLPHLIKAHGNIVNTASISGLAGDRSMVAYDTAKGAVVNFTRATAVDYGHEGVRVNAVCPGPVRTPLLVEALENETISREYAERIPLGRVLEPDDVAKAILFLASDDASGISGVNLPVDGGLSAWTAQPDIASGLTT